MFFFTSDFGITFEGGGELELVANADADYACKAADKRSVSGGAVMSAGACVGWFLRTQKSLTTLSTTNPEYVGQADAIKEMIFCGCTEKNFFDTYVLFSYLDPPRQGGRVPGTHPPPVDAIQTSI